MFYEKLTAKYWQEESAMHSEWALDYLLDGQFEKAFRHQRISAEYAENARCGMNIAA